MNNPTVKVLGYYDEDERAHLPEGTRAAVDYAISSGQPLQVLEIWFRDPDELPCCSVDSLMILDPRPNAGYVPVVLYPGDFKLEIHVLDKVINL